MQALHNPPHLNYYKLLEEDLDACFRFVEPIESHFEVYSIEFSRIILMAASEIENALRSFDAALNGSPADRSILAYCGLVIGRFPDFRTMEMFIPRCSYRFRPWSDWSDTASPDWWRNGYNKIKHDRLAFPGAATVRRAVESVGALQALLHHLYRVTDPEGWIADRAIPTVIVPYDDSSGVPGASSLWRPQLPDDATDNENENGGAV